MIIDLNKKKKIITLAIFIIAIILMIIGIVLTKENPNKTVVPEKVTDKNSKTEKNTNNNEDNKEVNNYEENEEIILIDNTNKIAKNFIPNYICGGAALDLDKTNKNIAELSNLNKMNMLLSIYQNEIMRNTGNSIAIPLNDINKYFDDLSFLNDFKPAVDTCTNQGQPCHENANINTKLYLPVYIRFNDDQLVIKMYVTGCTGPRTSNYYMELINDENNNNEQVLTYLYYYSKTNYIVTDKEESCNYQLYRNNGDNNLIDTVACDQINNYSFDITKFDKYKFVFDTTDNNLRLKSINYEK